MKIGRRNFIKTGALASVPFLFKSPLIAGTLDILSLKDLKVIQKPPLNIRVLNKMAFGPTPADIAWINEVGVDKYIDAQLNPDDSKDKEVKKRIARAKFPIKYNDTPDGRKVHVDEDRPLNSINKSLTELWKDKAVMKTENFSEWIRPAMETFAANSLRAAYSKWQLREMLVDFWHNHFNVTINSGSQIGGTFPSYDRDVIRKHCFGNFREFIEAVGKSTCMMFYLNNSTSKASPANENYARELFELHTLGEDHYFNHLYDEWREVPGATEGKAEGFIDEDVYEAARAFTGWTIGTGERTWRGEERLPDTGEFHYYDGWHDNYQKRIMGVEFKSNQPPMADGLMVYDLVASHPGTAKHLCTKICKRFVSDNPSSVLIQSAMKVWTDNLKDKNQIRKVLEVVLKSDEFKNTWGEKVKRPFEYSVSYVRALGSDFTPNQMYFWNLAGMGQKVFTWPTPTGHPDDALFWTSSGMMINRWKFIQSVINWKEYGIVKHNFFKEMPQNLTYEQIYDHFEKQVFGYRLSDGTRNLIINAFCEGASKDAKFTGNNEWRINNLVTGLGMLPEFNLR